MSLKLYRVLGISRDCPKLIMKPGAAAPRIAHITGLSKGIVGKQT